MHIKYDQKRKICHLLKSENESKTDFSYLNKDEKDDVINYILHDFKDDLQEVFDYMNDLMKDIRPGFKIGMFNYYVEGATNTMNLEDFELGYADKKEGFKKVLIPGIMFTYTDDSRDLNSISPTDVNMRVPLFTLVIPNDDCVFTFNKEKVILTKQLETRDGFYKNYSKRYGDHLILYVNGIRLRTVNNTLVRDANDRVYDLQILLFKFYMREFNDDYELAESRVREIFGINTYEISDLIQANSVHKIKTDSGAYKYLLDRIFMKDYDSRTIQFIRDRSINLQSRLYSQSDKENYRLIDETLLASINHEEYYDVFVDRVDPELTLLNDVKIRLDFLRNTTQEEIVSKGGVIQYDENDNKVVLFEHGSRLQNVLKFIQQLKVDNVLAIRNNTLVRVSLTRRCYMQPHLEDKLDSASMYNIVYAIYNKDSINNILDFIPGYDESFNKICVTPKLLFKRAFIRAAKNMIRDRYEGIKEFYINPELLNDVTVKTNSIKSSPEYIFNGIMDEMIKVWRSTFKCYTQVSVNSLINLASYMSELRKIKTFVKDSNSISNNQQVIHNTMLNRIDFTELPTGPMLGITNQLACGCKVSKNGIMNVEYYKVNKGIIDTSKKYYMDAIEESKYVIAQYSDVEFSSSNKISNYVLARVPSRIKFKMEMQYVKPEDIDFVTTTMDSALGYVTATIPFMGSNDSVRCTFGVNQSKQAKTLLNPEKPIIMTDAYIDVKTEQFNKYKVKSEDSSNNVFYTSCDNSVITYNRKYSYDDFDVNGKLYKTFDDDLIDTNIIKDGIYEVGVNALIAYIPNGSNYEDAVSISDRLSHKLTSFRIDSNAYERLPLDKHERANVKYGTVQQNDLITSVKLDTGKYKDIIHSKSESGLLINRRKIKDKGSDTRTLIFDTLCIDPVMSGDKITNRHGNKGVKAYDENNFRCRNSNMPILPNGEFIDIVYNSLGVISRMNYGQIKECQLGLIGYILGVSFAFSASNKIKISYINELIKRTYNLINSNDFESELKAWNIPESMRETIRQNKKFIRSWQGCMNEDGTCNLYDPMSGNKIVNNVIVGINYVYKMVQESYTKVNSRGGVLSNMKYADIMGGPLEGGSVIGGQRLGEMEINALMAYGADKLLYECLSYKGDNPSERANYYHKIVGDKIENKWMPRRSVIALLQYFLSLGIVFDSPNVSSKKNLIPENYDISLPEYEKYNNDMNKTTYSHSSYELIDYYRVAALKLLEYVGYSNIENIWYKLNDSIPGLKKLIEGIMTEQLHITNAQFSNFMREENHQFVSKWGTSIDYIAEFTKFTPIKIKSILNNLRKNTRDRNIQLGQNFIEV